MKILKVLFKQNRYLNLITILVSILFFCLLYILIINIKQTDIEIKSARNFGDSNVYQVSDDLIGESEQKIFSKKKSFEVLNTFNQSLSGSSEFTFYSATWQPIYVTDFNGDKTFDPAYEYGDSTPPVELDGDVYHNVSALQINQPVFELNNLQILKGKQFSKEDYFYNTKSNYIPLILGNNYLNLYQQGDYIDIFLYDKKITGKVIGFLDSSQKIMTVTEPEVILDNYIILPNFNFKDNVLKSLLSNSSDDLFVRAALLSTANSLILTGKSSLEIRQTMDYISKKTSFDKYQIIGANDLSIDALVNMTEINTHLVYLLCAILFLITLISFSMILWLKIKKNISVYAVLLISGANGSHIRRYIQTEFIIIATIGIIIAMVPFIIMFYNSINILIILLFTTIAFVIVFYLFIKYFVEWIFEKVDIVQRTKE